MPAAIATRGTSRRPLRYCRSADGLIPVMFAKQRNAGATDKGAELPRIADILF